MRVRPMLQPTATGAASRLRRCIAGERRRPSPIWRKWRRKSVLWEPASGQPLATLQGHTGAVYGVVLSGDGRLEASGGVDGLVRVGDPWGEASFRTLRSVRC